MCQLFRFHRSQASPPLTIPSLSLKTEKLALVQTKYKTLRNTVLSNRKIEMFKKIIFFIVVVSVDKVSQFSPFAWITLKSETFAVQETFAVSCFLALFARVFSAKFLKKAYPRIIGNKNISQLQIFFQNL